MDRRPDPIDEVKHQGTWRKQKTDEVQPVPRNLENKPRAWVAFISTTIVQRDISVGELGVLLSFSHAVLRRQLVSICAPRAKGSDLSVRNIELVHCCLVSWRMSLTTSGAATLS